MQKQKVKRFLGATAVALLLLPIFNLCIFQWGNLGADKPEKVWRSKVFFSAHAIGHFLNSWLYRSGISPNASQVFVGQDGWLFLGDSYLSTVSAKRMPDLSLPPSGGLSSAAMNLQAWQDWLKTKDVKAFSVLLGADKESAYPDRLPDWAKPIEPHSTTSYINSLQSSAFVQTKQPLLEAKQKYREPLYYKTDTHWNHLGAWVAYQSFADSLRPLGFPLQFLKEDSIKIHPSRARIGGDLAKFLRIQSLLVDEEIDIELRNPTAIEVIDFKTKKNIDPVHYPHLGTPSIPTLVTAKDALNKTKVLWLRDSFGNSLSVFMSKTFSATLQVHYESLDSQRFAALVEEFQPDYVFVTVVERAVRNPFFLASPPSFSKKGTN
jgi:alginate O-acetyltransferase complex protein AlgJ